MDSNNMFPTFSGSITPEQISELDANAIVSTDWYTPNSYAYEQPYLTPFPSSSVESQQWNQYARASFPDINMSTFPIDQTTNLFQQPIPITPGRPRSSPSTFGPSPENLSWAPSAGLGIQYPTAQPTPLIPTAAFPPTPYQPDPVTTTATTNPFPTSPPPTLQQPRPTRPQAPTPYQPIAPAPTTTGTKRRADSLDPPTTTNTTTSPTPRTSSTSTSKRRRTASVEGLSESSKTLLRLKEDEDLPWKDIAQQMGSASVPALQMQWRRLRDRRREWGEEDVRALRQACEWWERGRWEIVSAKMLEFGVQDKWQPKSCEKKWREMVAAAQAAQAATTGPGQQFAGTVGAGVPHVWMTYR